MKKRRLVVILAAVAIVGVMLKGCGSTVDPIDKEIKEESDSEETDGKEDSKEVTIAEEVLLDEGGVIITAIGLEEGWLGTDLKILIENNSDKNLTVQTRNSSVNGFMVDTMISEDVAAGKKVNTTVTFSTSGLKEGNITTIADMELSFHIFDTESWEEYLDSDMIVIKTSAAEGYVQEFDDSGAVFYDEDGIRIIGKGLSNEDSIFGPGLILYIENNTEKNITVQARDTSVNGFMIDNSLSQEVTSGKKALTALTFFESSLEENGIEEIEQIETLFHIFETESWDEIADTDVIVVEFE